MHFLKNIKSKTKIALNELHPALILAARLLFGAWFIWLCHVIGYVDQLGIGVNGLIGREVSGDLFFEFMSAVVSATIFSIPITYFIFLLLNSEIARKLGVPPSAIKATIIYGSGITILAIVFSYVGFIDPTSALSYGTSTRTAILCSLALIFSILLLFFSKSGSLIHSSAALICVAGVAFFLGEVKAGSEGYSRQQVIYFDDGTQLAGRLLHRVEGGVIFRKSFYFAFDTGTIFVPLSAIRFIGEPQRKSPDAGVALRNDYPAFVEGNDDEN